METEKRLTELVKPIESSLPTGERQFHAHHPNGTASSNIGITGAVGIRDSQVVDGHMTATKCHMTMAVCLECCHFMWICVFLNSELIVINTLIVNIFF